MKTLKNSLEQKTALAVVNEQKNLIGIRRLVDRPIGLITKAWKWIWQQQISRSNVSRLRLENSISLGQKRFAAVIEVQGMRFLVGGGASNVELLARLDSEAGFGKVLDQTKTKSNEASFERVLDQTKSKSNEVSFETVLEQKGAKSRTRQPKSEAQKAKKTATAKKKAVKKSAAKVNRSGKAKRAA